MSIKVKAIERKLKFEAGEDGKYEYRYVLQADLYNKLTQAKVIQEASLRSGISKGAINAAWDAIGEVIKAWATEGHSVAIPGLGSMRFGLRSKSVRNVNDVAAKLITSRRVIFTPSSEIKNELNSTAVAITCVDRDGKVVKRVTASNTESGDFEIIAIALPEEGGVIEGAGYYDEGDTAVLTAEPNAGYRFVKWSDGETDASRTITVTEDVDLQASFEKDPSAGSGTDNGSSGSTRQYALNISSANTAQGTVSGGGTFNEGASATITATPKSGYAFDKWSDGNTQASRSLTIDKTYNLVASFIASTGSGTGETDGTEIGGDNSDNTGSGGGGYEFT